MHGIIKGGYIYIMKGVLKKGAGESKQFTIYAIGYANRNEN